MEIVSKYICNSVEKFLEMYSVSFPTDAVHTITDIIHKNRYAGHTRTTFSETGSTAPSTVQSPYTHVVILGATVTIIGNVPCQKSFINKNLNYLDLSDIRFCICLLRRMSPCTIQITVCWVYICV